MTDSGPLVAYLRAQAAYCGSHGSPLYGVLGQVLADDVAAGGPVADVLATWVGPEVTAARLADEVPALRLLGGLHRLVLERRAPELALYFPSVGGTADAGSVGPVLVEAVRTHADVLRHVLTRPPQTNEVGRSAPLRGGLVHVAARSGGLPVRLFEIGASAGLNLRVDRLPIGPGRLIDSPLPDLAAPAQEVVERIGGDLDPVDPLTTQGRLVLTSYVWPDDTGRLERLRVALELADDEPAQLLRIGAAELVESIELRPGMVTVLWHSVMWQYLSADERARTLAAVEGLAAAATATAPFAHLRFERGPDPGPGQVWVHQVRLSMWPHGPDDGLLGTAPAHGVPVAWVAGP